LEVTAHDGDASHRTPSVCIPSLKFVCLPVEKIRLIFFGHDVNRSGDLDLDFTISKWGHGRASLPIFSLLCPSVFGLLHVRHRTDRHVGYSQTLFFHPHGPHHMGAGHINRYSTRSCYYCCCRSLCKPYTPRHRHPLSGPHMYTASHPSPIAYVGICYKGLRCISIPCLCRCDCDTPGGRFADYHPDPDPDVISCQLHRPNSFFSATRGGGGQAQGLPPKILLVYPPLVGLLGALILEIF